MIFVSVPSGVSAIMFRGRQLSNLRVAQLYNKYFMFPSVLSCALVAETAAEIF
jgi:hypothetical protein